MKPPAERGRQRAHGLAHIVRLFSETVEGLEEYVARARGDLGVGELLDERPHERLDDERRVVAARGEEVDQLLKSSCRQACKKSIVF